MTNRLAESSSLYLRKHAQNPIDWWPWCEEALAIARQENKPIFLSIGYSSCHWCTVMEGEAFSDTTIAQYMNTNFLPMKVDREERPDLDSIYMQGLQMMVGQGGWPLNVFLDPKTLIPFYGGTYFPIEPRYGRPGFLQVLQAVRRHYDTETAKVDSVTAEILDYLQKSAALQSQTQQKLDAALLRRGIETNASVLKGVGYGPSFPMMPYAELVLRGVRLAGEGQSKSEIEQVCTQRGLDLALGGIYDHVAGGFHRYTVDPTWTVPHFEKMLYDNGQILEYLANLWSSGIEEPAFQRAIAGTVKWLKREMTAPEGYFYAAQDADNFNSPAAEEPEEGDFYVWSYEELAHLLTPEELAEITEHFTVTEEGNFEGRNVLQRNYVGELSDIAEVALAKMFALRYGDTAENLLVFPPARNNEAAKTGNWTGRIPPVTDTKAIVAWNSLMISGLARAYAVFGEPEYLALAVKAANFILDRQWVNDRFHRLNYDGQPAVLAQSEDYALFVKALLDLHQASLRRDREREEISQFPNANFWLEKAVKVQTEFDEFLWSIELAGYYNTASDSSGELVVRERSYNDNATPSANGVAIANSIRLALLTENLEYLDRAEQALQAFSMVMSESPQACPGLFTALDLYLHHTLVRTNAEQLNLLSKKYLPAAVSLLTDNLPAGSIALVCQGLSCQEPAKTNEQMWQQIREIGNRE